MSTIVTFEYIDAGLTKYDSLPEAEFAARLSRKKDATDFLKYTASTKSQFSLGQYYDRWDFQDGSTLVRTDPPSITSSFTNKQENTP